jgi:hypothetical protein
MRCRAFRSGFTQIQNLMTRLGESTKSCLPFAYTQIFGKKVQDTVIRGKMFARVLMGSKMLWKLGREDYSKLV